MLQTVRGRWSLRKRLQKVRTGGSYLCENSEGGIKIEVEDSGHRSYYGHGESDQSNGETKCKMIRVLQINIGVGRAAQELAMATANRVEVDVLIISGQYPDCGEDTGWYPDSNDRAAIAVLGSISVDKIGPPMPGFRWLEMKGYRLYSCYISPNVRFPEFEAFLAGLEASVRGASCPVVIDFNSKSPEWGSPFEDNRGRVLADLIAARGLAVCNEGKKPTFVRDASESHLDLTFVTQKAMRRITRWTIIEKESLSLHKYIVFNVSSTHGQPKAKAKKGWAYKKIDYHEYSVRYTGSTLF
ncbi:hypothetical protein QTP88_028903 [Uroleucon formosanum]